MKYNIIEILKELEEGKISCKKAIKLMKTQERKIFKRKKASKIKISVIDESSNTSIKLPGIPFWLLSFFGTIGVGIINISIKKGKEIDKDLKIALDILDEIDLKLFIKELKNCDPFDLVHVKSSDSNVRISIL